MRHFERDSLICIAVTCELQMHRIVQNWKQTGIGAGDQKVRVDNSAGEHGCSVSNTSIDPDDSVVKGEADPSKKTGAESASVPSLPPSVTNATDTVARALNTQ